MKSQSTFSFLVAMVIFVILPLLRKKNRAGKKSSSASSARSSQPAPRVFVPRKKDDDCDYGEVNHQYSHQAEKRSAQVKGYLKAGLIDEKEYRQMIQRYSEQEHWYDRQ